jgi:hypothetical protein
MTRTKYSGMVILALMGVGWLTAIGATMPTTADPPGTAVGGSTDPSATEKAVAARKERCRLHPGTCRRGQPKPEPPKPSQP